MRVLSRMPDTICITALGQPYTTCARFAMPEAQGHNRRVTNPDRLSGVDASFLHLETGGAHRHVGSGMVFEGDAPSYDELVEHVERRLHLVPRYRQRLVEVPFDQGRPVWADDAHFNVGYHVRHTALPPPVGVPALRTLLGDLFSQELDRCKPLWELWLVERVG